MMIKGLFCLFLHNQRTNGPVNAHLIPWPSKGQPVLEKKIFEGFLPYMGMAAILVM